MGGGFDLEGGVFDADVEVFGDAGLEVPKLLGDVPLREAGFVDDDMGGEDRQPKGESRLFSE